MFHGAYLVSKGIPQVDVTTAEAGPTGWNCPLQTGWELTRW